MKTLGVIAQKGGTGKTTLSVHLAVQATRDGMRVLLLDMDPQASATAWWKRRRDDCPELIQAKGDALARILEQAKAQAYDLVIADTAPPTVQLIPARAQGCRIMCSSRRGRRFWIWMPLVPLPKL